MLEDRIQFLNSHWERLLEVPEFHRTIFPKIMDQLSTKHITTLIGPRRVGKTTLVKQVMVELIQSRGIDPLNILYFSFDTYRESPFKLLEVYKAQTGVDAKQTETYIFFDEVQYIENWGAEIKFLFDGLDKCTLLVTGSSTSELNRGNESLAGREIVLQIDPLSFDEYCDITDYRPRTVKNRSEYYLRYMRNQLPEMAKNNSLGSKYITDLVDKAIDFDISKLFNISHTEKIKDIFSIVCKYPGQIIIFRDLGSELGLDQRTVSKYFDYLEEVKLIRKVRKFSPTQNPRKKYLVSKRSARYYPYFSSLLQFSGIQDIQFGYQAETEVAFQLQTSYYWNEGGLKEIDFIIDDQEIIIGLEVKMKNSIRWKDVKWLQNAEFIDERYMITKPESSIPEEIKDQITCIRLDQLSDHLSRESIHQ